MRKLETINQRRHYALTCLPQGRQRQTGHDDDRTDKNGQTHRHTDRQDGREIGDSKSLAIANRSDLGDELLDADRYGSQNHIFE